MFSLTTLVQVYLANAGWMALIFAAQMLDKSLPPYASIIPGTRQRFLHMKDFHTMTWGDYVALPLVINAFVVLVIDGHIGLWQWVLFAVVTVVDGLGFWKMCSGKNHKDDAGYHPNITLCGLLHLPYHGAVVAMSLLVLWHWIAIRDPGDTALYVALVGGAIYIASFVCDIRAGNFDPLKREFLGTPTGL